MAIEQPMYMIAGKHKVYVCANIHKWMVKLSVCYHQYNNLDFYMKSTFLLHF